MHMKPYNFTISSGILFIKFLKQRDNQKIQGKFKHSKPPCISHGKAQLLKESIKEREEKDTLMSTYFHQDVEHSLPVTELSKKKKETHIKESLEHPKP